MDRKKYDVVVVGAGMAGLTAATYLADRGKKVLLVEKNNEVGGLVSSFDSDGFHFEAGVRALEDAGIIFPMLKDMGIELEVVRSRVSLGIENEIIDIEDINSLKEYRNLLVKIYPESQDEIDALMKIIRRIMRHMDVLYGIENPVFKNLMRDRKYIFKKLLPWLPKFLFTVGKINRLNMPVEEYLEDKITNVSLRDIISQHFFKNTPTFFALSYFSLYLDYFYPKGGVGKLADTVAKKLLECGGEIKTNTQIIKVLASGKSLKDQNNITYDYDFLVWAADLKTLYKAAGTDGLPPFVINKIEEQKNAVMGSRGSDSVFSLYLQVDEPLETFERIAHGHFFYTPSRQGLNKTHREELYYLLDNWEKLTKHHIYQWLDKFTKYNTYEISIPGLKDPSLAPDGKTGVIISLLAEYDLFKKVWDSGWHVEFDQELENRIIDVITASVYPVLKEKIIKRFSFTPISIAERVGSSEGAIVGWSFEKPPPVVNKIQIADRSVLTPIPSVFQAGQWAYSPAGVPMSILTGKIAADKILKKHGPAQRNSDSL